MRACLDFAPASRPSFSQLVETIAPPAPRWHSLASYFVEPDIDMTPEVANMVAKYLFDFKDVVAVKDLAALSRPEIDGIAGVTHELNLGDVSTRKVIKAYEKQRKIIAAAVSPS